MRSGELVAGKYRLDARLGIGGMGEVWRATHIGTGRGYAIKFMHAHVAASATARERFSREARASAAVNHPAVIDVFDVGEHDEGALYLAMELLDGIPLADAFHASPPLTIHDLCVVMHDTARALAAAHAAGIVHRDIKPANIFLHKDRATGLAAAKILDFGISKFSNMQDQTGTGAVLGSPRYMSPEQTRSAAAVDHRADLWACGVILFEGLAGTWPHEGDSYSSLVVAICTAPPRSIDQLAPDAPEHVRAIVRDCLKPLDQRLSTATELAERLAASLRDPALATTPLALPLHPPTESIKSTTGVRIRPLLSTTGSGVGFPAGFAVPAAPGSSPGLGRSPSGVMQAPLAGPLPPPTPPPLGRSESGIMQSPVAAISPPTPLPGPRPYAPTVPLPVRGQGGTMALDGTLETLATTTLREPAGAARESAVPVPPPSSAAVVPAARTGQGLKMALAALSVLLAGIMVTLIVVLRSGAPAAEGVAASGASASQPVTSAPAAPPGPPPSAPPAEPATAQPTGAPSATAPATAHPTAAPVAAEGRHAKAPPPSVPVPPAHPAGGSKVKQLGSGL